MQRCMFITFLKAILAPMSCCVPTSWSCNVSIGIGKDNTVFPHHRLPYHLCCSLPTLRTSLSSVLRSFATTCDTDSPPPIARRSSPSPMMRLFLGMKRALRQTNRAPCKWEEQPEMNGLPQQKTFHAKSSVIRVWRIRKYYATRRGVEYAASDCW